MASLTVAVNERGIRIGQYHQNATLSDRDVDLMLDLRAAGWGWRRLSAKFECSKRTVRDICAGKRRSQIPASWKVIKRPEPETV